MAFIETHSFSSYSCFMYIFFFFFRFLRISIQYMYWWNRAYFIFFSLFHPHRCTNNTCTLTITQPNQFEMSWVGSSSATFSFIEKFLLPLRFIYIFFRHCFFCLSKVGRLTKVISLVNVYIRYYCYFWNIFANTAVDLTCDAELTGRKLKIFKLKSCLPFSDLLHVKTG